MGIESDRLVYDYLSQVGELAQQYGLPSRDRMRLVATVRSEIEQRRAGAGSSGGTEAGVKRILGKLGTPAEVVAKAGGSAPSGFPGAAGTGTGGGTGPTAPGPDAATRARRALGGWLGRGGEGGGPARGAQAPGTDPAPGVPAQHHRSPGHRRHERSHEDRTDTSPPPAAGAYGTAGADGRRGSGTGPDTAHPAGDGDRPRRTSGDGGAEGTYPASGAEEAGEAPDHHRPPRGPAAAEAADGPPASGGPSGGPGPAGRRLSRTARERLAGFADRSGLSGRGVPGPRKGADPLPGADPDRPAPPSPPHLAGEDELSSRESDPDWWRTDPGPFGERRDGSYGTVDGFTGGIEIPELLAPPPDREEQATTADADGVEQEDAAGSTGPAADTARGGLLRRALRRRGGKAARKAGAAKGGGGDGGGGGAGLGLMPLAAVALLVAGAALGNVIVLAIGWLVAYYLCRLTAREAKLAVLVLPGLVATAAMVWVWGRLDGRWGEPIPEDGLGEVIKDAWPVVVRTAAVASALFLLWRARRGRKG